MGRTKVPRSVSFPNVRLFRNTNLCRRAFRNSAGHIPPTCLLTFAANPISKPFGLPLVHKLRHSSSPLSRQTERGTLVRPTVRKIAVGRTKVPRSVLFPNVRFFRNTNLCRRAFRNSAGHIPPTCLLTFAANPISKPSGLPLVHKLLHSYIAAFPANGARSFSPPHR